MPSEAEAQEAEPYPGHLPGDRVLDREEQDAKHLRVLARKPSVAKDTHIAAIGKSVAEVNAGYPAEDPVYVCVYESGLDERFGARWQDWGGAYLAYHTGNKALRTYDFPGSRLAEAEDRPDGKWQEAAQDSE